MEPLQSYELKRATERFQQQLELLDVEELRLEAYPAFYLRYLLQHKMHYLKLYLQVLQKLLNQVGKQPADLCLIDYGTGNGLLAMLAAVAGFSKVIAIDADPVFLQAAQQTAEAMAINQIQFLLATEENMGQMISVEKPAVLAGTDVIEHIYNLELFFQAIYQMKHIETIVFTTASNPENPFIVNKYRRMHLKEELMGGDVDDRKLFGEAHPSFLSIRKKMIRDYQPQLKEDVLHQLATATRGLKRKDIATFVDAFLQTGRIGKVISHPTNTCDPETGSWAERMVDLQDFQELFNQNGFCFHVSNGFYDRYKGNVLKRAVVFLLNTFIKWVPQPGIKLSPFIFLVGQRR